jgi:probable rRNA maturation factor
VRLSIHKEVSVRVPRAAIERLFRRIMLGERLSRHGSLVNLVFTDNRTMRRLNRRYRHKDRTTDVLSFNIDEPSQRGGTFGEIYISVPVALSQARTLDHSPAREFLRLSCHGLLHLCGHDHQRPKPAEEMRDLEYKYLTSIRGA